MVAGCIIDECASSVSAERLWKVTAAGSSVLPEICPEFIAGAETQGDGGPGSIRTLRFKPAVEQATVLKTRVLAMDAASHVVKYEVMQGGRTSEKLKSQTIEWRLDAAAGGGEGCVMKTKVEYETKAAGEDLSEEEKKQYTQGFLTLFKAIEAYLVANPTAYA